MSRAIGHLRDQKIAVKEVAWKCGYAHTTNFVRDFRESFGVTPASYRSLSATEMLVLPAGARSRSAALDR